MSCPGLSGGLVGLFSANQHSTFSTNVLTTRLLYYRVAALVKVRCRCYWLLLKYLLLCLFYLCYFFLLWSILIMYVSIFFSSFNVYRCTVSQPHLRENNRHITNLILEVRTLSEDVFHFNNIKVEPSTKERENQHPQTIYCKSILLRIYTDRLGRKI